MVYSLFDSEFIFPCQSISTPLYCISEKESPRIHHSNKRVVGKASNPIVNVTIGDTVFVEADAVVEIACPVTGKPKPKITWQRRGLY